MDGVTHADVAEIVHGTTLVTNAMIERSGAPVGLITTEGFRDILEMGTEQRYDIYDLFVQFPEPLVRRDLRLEVPERVDSAGRVVTAARRGGGGARRAMRWWRRAASAVAVGFLHSYANPAHERPRRRDRPRRASRICRCRFPARWWPRWANTSAASPPRPMPSCSR